MFRKYLTNSNLLTYSVLLTYDEWVTYCEQLTLGEQLTQCNHLTLGKLNLQLRFNSNSTYVLLVRTPWLLGPAQQHICSSAYVRGSWGCTSTGIAGLFGTRQRNLYLRFKYRASVRQSLTALTYTCSIALWVVSPISKGSRYRKWTTRNGQFYSCACRHTCYNKYVVKKRKRKRGSTQRQAQHNTSVGFVSLKPYCTFTYLRCDISGIGQLILQATYTYNHL